MANAGPEPNLTTCVAIYANTLQKLDTFLYTTMSTMANYTIKPRIFRDLLISRQALLRTV